MKIIYAFGALCLLFLGGCTGGMPKGFVTETPEYADLLKMSPEEREAKLAAIEEEKDILDPAKVRLYKAGRPVYYGDSKTGFTLLWDYVNLYAYTFSGHKVDPMGQETEAMEKIRTDKYGNHLYYAEGPNAGKPIQSLFGVSHQEGAGRLHTKGMYQVAGGIVQNTGAAGINAATNKCGGRNGCGPPIINQVQAISGSESVAVVDGVETNATIIDASTCGDACQALKGLTN